MHCFHHYTGTQRNVGGSLISSSCISLPRSIDPLYNIYYVQRDSSLGLIRADKLATSNPQTQDAKKNFDCTCN